MLRPVVTGPRFEGSHGGKRTAVILADQFQGSGRPAGRTESACPAAHLFVYDVTS